MWHSLHFVSQESFGSGATHLPMNGFSSLTPGFQFPFYHDSAGLTAVLSLENIISKAFSVCFSFPFMWLGSWKWGKSTETDQPTCCGCRGVHRLPCLKNCCSVYCLLYWLSPHVTLKDSLQAEVDTLNADDGPVFCTKPFYDFVRAVIEALQINIQKAIVK